MHYCFVQKTKVYGCDHYDCNNKDDRDVGTKISGMRYCLVYKKHVYSCDHADCN